MDDNPAIPTPQEFIKNGQFRVGGPHGIEARLDGILYDVAEFGTDAVQVLAKGTGQPIATLTIVNGKFVVPGS